MNERYLQLQMKTGVIFESSKLKMGQLLKARYKIHAPK